MTTRAVHPLHITSVEPGMVWLILPHLGHLMEIRGSAFDFIRHLLAGPHDSLIGRGGKAL